jgi:hypothetical protein
LKKKLNSFSHHFFTIFFIPLFGFVMKTFHLPRRISMLGEICGVFRGETGRGDSILDEVDTFCNSLILGGDGDVDRGREMTWFRFLITGRTKQDFSVLDKTLTGLLIHGKNELETSILEDSDAPEEDLDFFFGDILTRAFLLGRTGKSLISILFFYKNYIKRNYIILKFQFLIK